MEMSEFNSQLAAIGVNRLRGKMRSAPIAETVRSGRLSISWVGFVGVVLLTVLIVLALVPGSIAPYDPKERVGAPLARPSAAFILGANDIGQDLLSELIWGTRVSLTIGLVVGVLAVAVGVIVGLVSGYRGGWLGALLMRLVELTLVLPLVMWS
jgi:ABC-type dipeptide/oligopeptide/nickel transport system permease subunit